MTITLTQGIILSLIAIICGFDFWLEGLYIFRPIIVCTLTGLVLGDIHLGLIAGGLTELAFAGLTPAGGTQPPNPILAGVMTVVIGYTTKSSAAASIGLALPFSFLMQYVILFYYSIFSVFMGKADKYAKEANTKAFAVINIIPILIVGVSYGIIVFLSTYVAQAPMRALVSSMPTWLSHGFEIAGGILPAIGFGLLLQVMLKGKFMPYLLLGFLFASFIQFGNLLPVAVIGTAAALYEFNKSRDEKKEKERVEQRLAENNFNNGGGFDDGI